MTISEIYEIILYLIAAYYEVSLVLGNIHINLNSAYTLLAGSGLVRFLALFYDLSGRIITAVGLDKDLVRLRLCLLCSRLLSRSLLGCFLGFSLGSFLLICLSSLLCGRLFCCGLLGCLLGRFLSLSLGSFCLFSNGSYGLFNLCLSCNSNLLYFF